MPVTTLSFTDNGNGLVSGIPKTVTITSSSPATIYYTLDGSVPTPLSSLYIDPVKMPTDIGSVTLSAVGYYSDGYGLVPTAVLSNVYGPDITDFRFMVFEYVAYVQPGGLNIPFWYDYNGEASVFVDIDPEEMGLMEAERNADGSKRDIVGDLERVPSSKTGTRQDDNFVISSEEGDNFNPEALSIVIDGFKEVSESNAILVNGPFMSLREPRKNFRGLDFRSQGQTNNVSGSMVRYFVNRDKGLVVFYYFDSNSCRWIKSIQPLSEFKNPVADVAPQGNPFVFPWNYHRTKQPY